jgi:transposase InsO family protein
MALRDAMQRVALEFPCYGWPRMTRELKRRGWAANHKRVYRLMREDNLLCLRKRRFVVTTDSDHGLAIYPNLARRMTLTGLDQLWVADLTYIRLELEFVYLAVILDAFSRRVVGWALDRELSTALTLQALEMALAERRPAPRRIPSHELSGFKQLTSMPQTWLHTPRSQTKGSAGFLEGGGLDGPPPKVRHLLDRKVGCPCVILIRVVVIGRQRGIHIGKHHEIGAG